MTRTSAGPWSYDAESGLVLTKDPAGDWWRTASPYCATEVCNVNPLDGISNGELIAAAPELADALAGMLVQFNEQTPGILRDERERAVIAKSRAVLAKLDDAYDATDRTTHITDCASVPK